MRLWSSHLKGLGSLLTPSPQMSEHTDSSPRPPWQYHPVSTTHTEEHPSPSILLPSSHSSNKVWIPSPQRSVHWLSPLVGFDDGNLLPNDGCSPNCLIEVGWVATNYTDGSLWNGVEIVYLHITQLCGNGVRTISEQCDDGNSIPGDGCTNCKVDYGLTVDV